MPTRTSILLSLLFALTVLQPAIALWLQGLSEEFTDVKQLNPSQWIPAFYWQPDPSPNNELQTYRPDSFNFSSSTSLGIIASNYPTNPYISGVVTSKDRWSQSWGYFEFRARFPTAQGVMASFSLLPQDITLTNDIISLQVVLSNPRRVYFTQQCGAATTRTNGAFPNITDLAFHKFGIEWAQNMTNFFVDDLRVSSQGGCVSITPKYIAASLVVGGALAGSPNSSTSFPVTMDLDYIRAYMYSPTNGVTLPGPGDGIPVSRYISTTQPRVTLSQPSISNNVVTIGDTVSFNITIHGGGSDLSVLPAVNQSVVVISCDPFQLTNPPAISVSQFTNVTLYWSDSRSFTTVVPLKSVLAGFYRFALDMYEADGTTKIIGLNTIEVLQVLASPTTPLPVPIEPPVTPISLPVSTSVTSNVIPILDCYSPINTTHYRAYFSYNNTNNVAVSLPVGDLNKFTPGSLNRGQPTVFNTGRSSLFPDSVFVADIDSSVAWALSSYTLNVDISDTSSLCSNSVTIVIVVSSPSPINSTTINDLKSVIASQLNVTSDRVNINVTCTSATSCEITVTISADPSQLSDLIQKAKTYVTDPATVENTVKQVSPDLSVTEVRGTKTNTEKVGYSNPEPVPQSISSHAQVTTRNLSVVGLCTLLAISVL